jgi:SnoaL-like polyketide cyclase
MPAIPNIGGRDIADILRPQGQVRQDMTGFDPEYSDIVDYILRCTHRIWEQKDVGLIATHYAPDIRVHMMTGPVDGMGGVIAGTARTLSAFPDRTLTGEAVIWADHGQGTYLSSHRITSTATNLGASELGPATGKKITFTTIADCLCKANLIIEEWLVRDYSGMALALGYAPGAVAKAQAEVDKKASSARAAWRQEQMQQVRETAIGAFPLQDLPNGETEPEAFAHAVFSALITHRRFGHVRQAYSPAAHWAGPGNRRLFGWGEITGWYQGLIASFGDAHIALDHICAARTHTGSEIAIRWRLSGHHDGPALYGPASGQEVFVLAVTHWRLERGRIVDEVTIFDEVALLRQIEGGL